jgi:6,7-dimethyl-8-ribityllumazine synthase
MIGFGLDMAASGVAHEIAAFYVPGAFEMPLLALKLGQSGRFDAIVAAALLVNGGIYRNDFFAKAVASGLMNTQIQNGVPICFVSLTPHHFQPSETHDRFFHDYFVKYCAEAAQAARQILALAV